MSNFLKNVTRGRQGLNEGLPNGLHSLNSYIYGTQPSRYYLLGGESGTGKTTLADYMFLFAPYRHMKLTLEINPIKINWKYFSFEQGRRAKEASWGSKVMFDQFGERLPVAYLLGKGKNRISEEHYQLCIKVGEYVEELMDAIDMIDVPLTPTQFKNELYRYGAKHGKWHTRPLLDANGKPRKGKTGVPLMEVYAWTPNNPNESHIFIMDHIAYAAMEYPTLKQNIDTISRTMVYFREMTNWTFVVIQQFNTELSSIERQKFKKNAFAPQRLDFGDSKYTFQDADVVFGMLNPHSYDLRDFRGYNIDQLEGYAIWAFLMKNRHDGPAAREVPLLMDPVTGMFYEIPEMNGVGSAIMAMTDNDPIEPFYAMAKEFTDSISLYAPNV